MSFKFEGYADPESSEGFKFEGYANKPSRARSLASAPVKGAAKSILEGVESAGKVPIPGTDTSLQLLGGVNPAAFKETKALLSRLLPTQEALPEQLLERAGELAPIVAGGPGGLGSKVLQVGGGALAGQLAKAADIGETGEAIAEIAGMGIPGAVKAGARGIRSLAKAEPERMASGLSKPRAMGAKKPELALISSERQKKAINTLNEEASQLTKKSVEKHLPLSKQIEEGFDFEKKFETGFGNLKKAAERANPEIDITPITNYLNKTAKKYSGIPKLHPEASKIAQEVRALRNRPQTGLRNLMKIYRSNNQKVKSVYEGALVTGKQKEYVDFLTGLNQEIASSFRNTLPKDSAWVKEFDSLNKEFRNFKNTQETINKLKPIIEGDITPAKIQRLAADPKLQKKLTISMGEKGSQEVIQIAKDLKAATESIKKIPKKDLPMWNDFFPLSYLLGKIIAIPAGLMKAHKLGKYGYGYFLSSPARRIAYQNALKAIAENDIQSYKNSIAILSKELQKEEKD